MKCLPAVCLLLPAIAAAQGGNLGEGASSFSYVQLLLALIAGMGMLIAVGLLLVRPDHHKPPSVIGPALVGLGLAIPIVGLAVFAMLWLESLIAGAVVALGLGTGYVGFIAGRWRR